MWILDANATLAVVQIRHHVRSLYTSPECPLRSGWLFLLSLGW